MRLCIKCFLLIYKHIPQALYFRKEIWYNISELPEITKKIYIEQKGERIGGSLKMKLYSVQRNGAYVCIRIRSARKKA